MHFHAAATYLAQSLLPIAVSGSLTMHGQLKERLLDSQSQFQQAIAGRNSRQHVKSLEKGASGKQRGGPFEHGFSKYADGLPRMMIPDYADDPVSQVELAKCDPGLTAEEEMDEALGLLSSCQEDEICFETDISKSGGVCLKATAAIHQARQRRLQEYGQALCDADDNCNCDDYDAASSTGTVSCIGSEYCYTDTYCGISTVRFTHEGESLPSFLTYCLEMTQGEPGFTEYCRTADPPDCTIEVDGSICSSCMIMECPPGSFNYEFGGGEVFDCTNTPLGTSGSYCDGDQFLPFLGLPTEVPTALVSESPTGPLTEAPTVLPTAAPVASATNPPTAPPTRAGKPRATSTTPLLISSALAVIGVAVVGMAVD